MGNEYSQMKKVAHGRNLFPFAENPAAQDSIVEIWQASLYSRIEIEEI